MSIRKTDYVYRIPVVIWYFDDEGYGALCRADALTPSGELIDAWKYEPPRPSGWVHIFKARQET